MSPTSCSSVRASSAFSRGAQALELEHDHLLAERVAFAIGRQLESLERDLPRARNLDEEGVREAGPLARPFVAADDAIDDRVARLHAEPRQRERASALPRTRVSCAMASGKVPSWNSNCSPEPETLV